MSQASQFIAAVGKDSIAVYEAFEKAIDAADMIIDVNQDWVNGRTEWIFEDGSKVVMESTDVTVIDG